MSALVSYTIFSIYYIYMRICNNIFASLFALKPPRYRHQRLAAHGSPPYCEPWTQAVARRSRRPNLPLLHALKSYPATPKCARYKSNNFLVELHRGIDHGREGCCFPEIDNSKGLGDRLTMDEFVVSYSLENEQQFWDGTFYPTSA